MFHGSWGADARHTFSPRRSYNSCCQPYAAQVIAKLLVPPVPTHHPVIEDWLCVNIGPSSFILAALTYSCSMHLSPCLKLSKNWKKVFLFSWNVFRKAVIDSMLWRCGGAWCSECCLWGCWYSGRLEGKVVEWVWGVVVLCWRLVDGKVVGYRWCG